MNNNSICSSCRHESNCSFINHSKDAILMCEEFELDKVEKKEQAKDLKKDNTICNSQEYTGLCQNCDYRATCKLRDNNIVKWHCEEYAAA